MPGHGGCQFGDGHDLAFVTDNQAKGISSRPALTVHLSNARSRRVLGRDPTMRWWVSRRTGSLRSSASAAFTATQVQRWRYAGPVEVYPEPTVVWGSTPVVALAGEAFAGPKVEGAFLSGIAAAEAVRERLG